MLETPVRTLYFGCMKTLRWTAVAVVLLACSGEDPTGSDPDPPTDTTPAGYGIVSASPFHVLGSDALLGDYTHRGTAVEVVNRRTQPRTSFTLFDRADPQGASGLRLAVDSRRGYARVEATRAGDGEFLPLTFGTADREQVRIRADGGVQFRPSGARPACDEDVRMTLWAERNNDRGDTLWVCMRNRWGTYAWRAILD